MGVSDFRSLGRGGAELFLDTMERVEDLIELRFDSKKSKRRQNTQEEQENEQQQQNHPQSTHDGHNPGGHVL